MAQEIKENLPRANRVVKFYRASVSILGLMLWVVLALIYPIPTGAIWGVIGGIAFFLAFSYTFPIEIHSTTIAVSHIIFLGTGILYGPSTALWAALIGIGGGTFTRLYFRTGVSQARNSFRKTLGKSLFEFSLLVLPFVFSNALVDWQTAENTLTPMLNIIGTYIVLHAAFVCLDLWIKSFTIKLSTRQILVTLLVIELIPLPFLLVSLSASVSLGFAALVFIAGLPALMSVLLFDAGQSRARLERRVDDLSMLNQISEVISQGKDMPGLLEAIQAEITSLFGVDNFYIALLDPKTDMIWHPIAIKDGKHQEWARRASTGRLTDRVIQEQKPLLLTGKIDKTLEEIGAEPEYGDLNAWLGVPLQTAEGLRGCMAVFSNDERSFSEDDLKLLTAVSGQIGIALQNAMRQEQAGHRLSRQAEQLHILDEINRQLSGTLQAEHLFKLILQSALDYTQSSAGNIIVFNSVTNRYEVKAQQGYDDQHEADTTPLTVKNGRTLHPQILPGNGSAGPRMAVPINFGGDVIGMIFIEAPEAEAYTQNELDFVSQLAQQASQAIRNSELYEETQRRLREQATLSTIISQLTANKELDFTLNRVVQAFSAVLDSAYSGIYLWNYERGLYEFKAMMRRDETREATLPQQITLQEWRKIRHSQTDTGPLRVTADSASPAQMLKPETGEQVLIFPMDIGGQPVGLAINHLKSLEPLPAAELQLPRAVAANAAISIQNALLFESVSAGRDRLEAVLNSVGDGVLMVDDGGRITLANTPIEALTGSSQLRGKQLSTLPGEALDAIGMTRDEADRFNLAVNPETQEGEPSPPQRYQCRDRYYERFSAPVLGEAERSLGWIIVVRDITEAIQISETRELLTNTLVHDLRSPIGAIKTTLEILEETLLTDQPDAVVSQSLDIANRSTQRVLGLIESLLDIGHLESGQIELSAGPMDLRRLIVETVEEMIPQANEDQVVLDYRVPEELPPVVADQPMIRRVLINLIDNSLKFTPEGGLVTVSTEEDGDGKLHVCIADSGPGIPEEYRQEVFARFSQVPGTRGRRRGSGLGLTFCRLAIEAHDERIWIRDSDNERGVTLVFSLPLAPEERG